MCIHFFSSLNELEGEGEVCEEQGSQAEAVSADCEGPQSGTRHQERSGILNPSTNMTVIMNDLHAK